MAVQPTGPLPICPVHELRHPPVLCRECGVWHPIECQPKATERDTGPLKYGTHTLPQKFWTR